MTAPWVSVHRMFSTWVPAWVRPSCCGRLLAIGLGLVIAVAAAEETDSSQLGAIQRTGFEAPPDPVSTACVPGWTTYGAAIGKVAVERVGKDEASALKLSNAKAFCYQLPVLPTVDYEFAFDVKTNDALVRWDVQPSMAEALKVDGDLEGAAFDWRTVRIRIPAAARPAGTREMWISLGSEIMRPGGAAWFDNVTFEPTGGGQNVIPNPSFEEPVVEAAVPDGWALERGAADIAIDRDGPHSGAQCLRLTGRGSLCRLVQPLNLEPYLKQGVKRVRVSGWGRSRDLGEDRVRLEIYGSDPPLRPFLSLTGDSDWIRGDVILDVARQRDRKPAIWINAPRAFNGQAWFDDLVIEPLPDAAVVNLLENPTFRRATSNGSLPDYWGLWGDAVWCIEPWSLDYFGLVDEPGPIAGARVLRVHHPSPSGFTPIPPAKALSMFVLTGADLSLPPGDYTFSVYVKAARPGTAVHIRHPAHPAPLVTAKAGTEWSRITAAARDPKLLPAIHLPEPDSLVWLAAPQLEAGTEATPFSLGPGENDNVDQARPAAPPKHLEERVRDREPAPLALAAPPLQIYSEFDAYEAEKVARAKIKWAGPGDGVVHWRLMNAETGERLPTPTRAVEISGQAEQTFEIPIAELSPGKIGIQAVVTVDGGKAGRATDTFRKRTPSPYGARINRFTRSLEVQGKPFLPIFLPIEPQRLGDWHLDRLVAGGFNCLAAAPGRLRQEEIIQHGVTPAQAAEIRKQLDRLHSRGLKLLWPLSWSFDDWDRNRAIYQGNAAALAATYQHVVMSFRDHPAIIGWYLIDEPSKESWEGAFGFAESDLQMLWAAVKAADETRPAYINWNHTWAIEPYGGIQATDIVGHDDYSTSGEPFDWGALVPAVRMVNDARAGRRPAFAWISASYDELALRPNAAAVRVHAWLHLVYGTRGLGYWSKPSLDPEVWQEVQQINREAAALHLHAFGAPDAVLATRAKVGAAVHYAVWVAGDRAFLMCVNTANAPARVEFDVQAACRRGIASSRDLFDAAPGGVTDGVLRAAIPPLGRRVYRFILEPAL